MVITGPTGEKAAVSGQAGQWLRALSPRAAAPVTNGWSGCSLSPGLSVKCPGDLERPSRRLQSASPSSPRGRRQKSAFSVPRRHSYRAEELSSAHHSIFHSSKRKLCSFSNRPPPAPTSSQGSRSSLLHGLLFQSSSHWGRGTCPQATPRSPGTQAHVLLFQVFSMH